MSKFRCPDCGRFWPATSTGRAPCQCNVKGGPKPVKNAREAHTDLVLGRLGTLLELDHLSTSDKSKIELAIAEIKLLRGPQETPSVISVPGILTKEQHEEFLTQWKKGLQPVVQEILSRIPIFSRLTSDVPSFDSGNR